MHIKNYMLPLLKLKHIIYAPFFQIKKKTGKGIYNPFFNTNALKFNTFTGKINHFDQENEVRRV